MSNIDFKKVLDALKKDAQELATSTIKDFGNEAKKDALKMLEDLKKDLKDWTELYVSGELKKDELEFLVLGQKELIQMLALKNVGVAQIKVDDLKNKLFNLVVTTLIGLA